MARRRRHRLDCRRRCDHRCGRGGGFAMLAGRIVTSVAVVPLSSAASSSSPRLPLRTALSSEPTAAMPRLLRPRSHRPCRPRRHRLSNSPLTPMPVPRWSVDSKKIGKASPRTCAMQVRGKVSELFRPVSRASLNGLHRCVIGQVAVPLRTLSTLCGYGVGQVFFSCPK